MAIAPDLTPVVSATESARLCDLERTIVRFRMSFVDAGEALREIRDDRLYRSSFATFDDYCEQRWALKRTHSYQLIAAAEIVAVLKMSAIADIFPETESQARELTRLEDPQQQVTAWGKVVERVDGDPKKLTAKIIREEVDKLLPEEEESGFVAAEELAAIRKAVSGRVKKCPPPSRGNFGEAVAGVVEEVLRGVPVEAPIADEPAQAEPDPEPEEDPPAPHPFEELRARAIALQKDIKAALNADTPDAARLREIMTWAKVVRYPAVQGDGPIEFIPTMGIPLLLRLAIDPDPKPKLNESAVNTQYLSATGSWQPPWIDLQKKKRQNPTG